jgi:hypothetical protein
MSGYNYYLLRVVPSFTADQPLNEETTLPLPPLANIVEQLRTRFPNVDSDGVHGGWLNTEEWIGGFNYDERALIFCRIDHSDLREVCNVLGLVAFDPQKVQFLFITEGWPNITMEPPR